jgi:hypothetical protein
MRQLVINLKDKEYSKLLKLKNKYPLNRCHHNWYEYILFLARSYEKSKEVNK